MLVNLCYVSHGMGVGKVSNSKSGLKGHSGALAVVAFDSPDTIFYYSSIATMSLVLHHFRDIITYFLKFKEVM